MLYLPQGIPGLNFVRPPGRVPKTRLPSAKTSRGYGGMLSHNILKSRVSKLPFCAHFGNILQNSDGQNLFLLYSLNLGVHIGGWGPQLRPIEAHSSYTTVSMNLILA